MGLLTFSINVTLDGCVDYQEGIADAEARACRLWAAVQHVGEAA